MAKIFLTATQTAGYIVSNASDEIFGATGTQSISIAENATGLTIDANTESVTLLGALSDYKFVHAGTQLYVYLTAGTLVATIGTDDNGSVLIIGTTSYNIAMVTGGTMTLGGHTVTSVVSADLAIASASVAMDFTAPTVSTVAITSATGAANSTLSVGDVVTATVTMDSAVTVVGAPTITLVIGATEVIATYDSASSTTTALKFNYTILAAQTDADGIAVKLNSLTAGTSIKDAAGNDATLTHAAVANNAGYLVDTTAPSATATTATIANTANAVVQSSEAGTAYLVKSTLTAPTTAAELVTLNTNNDTSVNSVSITAANTNTNLAATGLVDGTYKVYTVDAAGNLSAASTNSVTIDTTAPVAATTGAITSTDTDSNSAGVYLAGDVITIAFSEAINTTTLVLNDITLNNGHTFGGTAMLAPVNASGGYATTFTITLGSAPTVAAADVITVASTKAVDVVGNQNASITFTVPANNDIAAPTAASSTPITNIDTDTNSTGVYAAGDVITIKFNEPVNTTTLTLSDITLSGSHSFGTGAALAATDASGGYATTFTITLGTAPTVAASDTISVAIAKAVDAATNANTSAITFTVPAIADVVAPTAAATTATIANTANAVVQSSEAGTAYLVKSTLTAPTTAAELVTLNTNNDTSVNSVSITAANTNTNLAATGLVDGTYQVYTVDAAGNLSAASTNSVTIDTTAPTAPTAVAVTPTGGTVVANTLNGTNTNMTAVATITAGEATGGAAVLKVGTTTIATDSEILVGDTGVTFTLGTSATNTLQAAVTAGGVVTVEVTDAAGNTTASTASNPTLVVDYTAPTLSWTNVVQIATASTISFTSNESGTAGLYANSVLKGSSVAVTANILATVTATAQSELTTTNLIVADAASNLKTSAKVFLGTTDSDSITSTTSHDFMFGFAGADTFTLAAQSGFPNYSISTINDMNQAIGDYEASDTIIFGGTAAAWTTAVSGWTFVDGIATPSSGRSVYEFYSDFSGANGTAGEVAAFKDGGNTYIFGEGVSNADIDNTCVALIDFEANAVNFSSGTALSFTAMTIANNSGTLTLGGTVVDSVTLNLGNQTISEGSMPSGGPFTTVDASTLAGNGIIVTGKNDVSNRITGTLQADTITGGNNNDYITWIGGADELSGGVAGPGSSILYFTPSTTPTNAAGLVINASASEKTLGSAQQVAGGTATTIAAGKAAWYGTVGSNISVIDQVTFSSFDSYNFDNVAAQFFGSDTTNDVIYVNSKISASTIDGGTTGGTLAMTGMIGNFTNAGGFVVNLSDAQKTLHGSMKIAGGTTTTIEAGKAGLIGTAGEYITNTDQLTISNLGDVWFSNGDNQIWGTANNNSFQHFGNKGENYIDGGEGTDTLFLNLTTLDTNATGIAVNLSSGTVTLENNAKVAASSEATTLDAGKLALIGATGTDIANIKQDTLVSIESIYGGSGDDQFFGSDNADNFSGGSGQDYFVGGAGADTVSGGDGADNINLGATLVSGTAGDAAANGGVDASVGTAGDSASVDTITFVAADDIFIIDETVFGVMGNGASIGATPTVLAANQFHTQAGTGTITNVDFDVVGNGAFIYDSTDNDLYFVEAGATYTSASTALSEMVTAGTAIKIADITITGTLAATDFLIMQ